MSFLQHLSKVFERVIYKQVNKLMDNKTSNYKWRKGLDKEENISTKFMDLSKAFDSIDDDLLLAKLRAYGSSKQVLSPMCSYVKSR